MISDLAMARAINERAEAQEMIGVAEQPEAVRIEYRLDCIIRDLDELCALAKDGKVNEYAAGQILTRAQLIAGFLQARRESGLRMVVNNV